MDDIRFEKEITAVERRLTSKRTTTVLMRKSQAELEEALENYQRDAMNEIRRAAVILAGAQMGPNDYSMEKIKTYHNPSEELAVWQFDQVKKLDEWRHEVPEKTYNITWDASVYGLSARRIAESRNSTHPTVMKHIRGGLDEYAILNGWIRRT